MAKQFNRELGKRGEEIAADYLRKKKYKIIENNFQTRFGEIDLIVSKDGILSFVEVKLKNGDFFGTPEEMIGNFKLSQVQRMAEFYLMDQSNMGKIYKIYSIDAVFIVLGEDGEVARISHYENLTF